MIPAAASSNDWVLSRRGARNIVDPWKPYHFLIEQEPDERGAIAAVTTVFLTNRECPWRCVMCDLWKNTLPDRVPAGAIPAQIDHALDQMHEDLNAPQADANPRHLKLYNSGSFFDPQAVPPEEYDQIADRCLPFHRVIVECHPSLVNRRVQHFLALLQDRGVMELEVAMGLETAQPEVLARLNKRMTLDLFARAADELRGQGIALRAFILVKPPFVSDETEALHGAERSLDFAFDQGAAVASLIPVRGGNGALEELARRNEFAPPKLRTLEEAFDYGLNLQRGRVFTDLWDLEQFSDCPRCFEARRRRLAEMNLAQRILPRVTCSQCHTAPNAPSGAR